MNNWLVDPAPKYSWFGEYSISIVLLGIVMLRVGLNWQITPMKHTANINAVFIFKD